MIRRIIPAFLALALLLPGGARAAEKPLVCLKNEGIFVQHMDVKTFTPEYGWSPAHRINAAGGAQACHRVAPGTAMTLKVQALTFTGWKDICTFPTMPAQSAQVTAKISPSGSSCRVS